MVKAAHHPGQPLKLVLPHRGSDLRGLLRYRLRNRRLGQRLGGGLGPLQDRVDDLRWGRGGDDGLLCGEGASLEGTGEGGRGMEEGG